MIVTEKREGGHKTRFLYRKRYEIGLLSRFVYEKQCEALKTLRKWRGEGFL
jgi:hypothetical protein